MTSDNYLDRRLRSIKNTNVEELRHDSAFDMSRTRSIAGGRRGMVSRRHLRFCNKRWFFNTSYLGHTFFGTKSRSIVVIDAGRSLLQFRCASVRRFSSTSVTRKRLMKNWCNSLSRIGGRIRIHHRQHCSLAATVVEPGCFPSPITMPGRSRNMSDRSHWPAFLPKVNLGRSAARTSSMDSPPALPCLNRLPPDCERNSPCRCVSAGL